MELAEKENCPICDCGISHVNNHVRMSNGNGHGPTQEYPDGWDRSTSSLDVDRGDDRDDDRGDLEPGDVAIGEHDQDDQDDQDDTELETLVIEDGPDDYRSYRCENDDCTETVEYLSDECPNGHGQNWVAV